MQKQAPTLGRLLTMVLFALSCFGLLLFLWLAFGGPVPLKPQGYQFKVAFPEATQLAEQADVRIAGVSVGKVTAKDLDVENRANVTIATIELNPDVAPIAQDARAILRQKTLLGETYVELTPGTKDAPRIPEDGWLDDAQVAESVQLDEIFQALDPVTRKAFQTWQQEIAEGIEGNGQNFNDALGNLPRFVASGDDVLAVLDAQTEGVKRLIRNTGVTFSAITENESQLANLITGSANTFGALAEQQEALAETFRIFPTFLDESRKTFVTLEQFSRNTQPLIEDLRPVARDLRPTLRAVKAFAPDLEAVFRKLDPLIDASKEGLPALARTLEATTPLLGQLQPFLEELNPILQYLEYYQWQTADFISNGAGALADTVAVTNENERGHYLRQWAPNGQETLAFWPTRPAGARGNAYLPPVWQGEEYSKRMIFPNADCANATANRPDGTRQVTPAPDEHSNSPDDSNPAPGGSEPSCWVAPEKPAFGEGGVPGQFPRITSEDYAE